jgi:hypothetical protein
VVLEPQQWDPTPVLAVQDSAQHSASRPSPTEAEVADIVRVQPPILLLLKVVPAVVVPVATQLQPGLSRV